MGVVSFFVSPALPTGRIRGEALLAALILARSTSYVTTKIALRELQALNLLGIRFIAAFLLLLPFAWRRLKTLSGRTFLQGVTLGAVFTAVMAAEVYGLRTANASTAAFLENTSLVFVPLFEAVLRRSLPGVSVALSTLVSLAGIALLTLRGGTFSPSTGELLCLAAAVFYACAVILTDRFSHDHDNPDKHNGDPLTLGILQVGFMGLFSMMLAFLFETPVVPVRASTWGAILYQAIVCTCFGFTLQPLAQSRTTSERAGLLCALGPVGGALSGWLFLGESLSPVKILGMFLILSGMLLPKIYDTGKHKKLNITAWALALFFLAWTVPACAEIQKFEHFDVNVPDGWTAEQQGSAVVIMAGDMSASVSIAIGPMGEATLEDIALAFAEQMDGTEPQLEDDVYIFNFTDLTGIDSVAIVGEGENGNYLAASIAGYNDAVDGILDSVEFTD